MDGYTKGFIDGITAFAYMKDGVYYVGTTGKTLEKAIEDVKKTWNYSSPTGGVLLTGQNHENYSAHSKLGINSGLSQSDQNG